MRYIIFLASTAVLGASSSMVAALTASKINTATSTTFTSRMSSSKASQLLRGKMSAPLGTISAAQRMGTNHRCTYKGPAKPLDPALTQAQRTGLGPSEMYYGKPRENDFYQHLFIASECTNGLPPASSACFSSLQVGQHCGPDEDWSIIAPDEFDGPGVMWRNEETCDADVHVTDVTIIANFFCPTEVECIHLHRCSFTGNPTPLTSAAKEISGLPGVAGEINSNADSAGLAEGYFEHQFTAEECSNGLPPVGGGPGSSLNGDVNCVTSLRYAESCGGDHDWDASSPSDGGAAVRWYTSHTCDQAKVAVDYFCVVNKIDAGTGADSSSLGDHRRIHRCTFKGQSDLDTAASADSWCEFPMASPTKGQGGKERHAGDPAPGFCLSHKFKEAECTNGLPPVDGGDCVVTRQRLRECGAEQDWMIVGPSDANNAAEAVKLLVPAGVMWYNALETGPCGEASITVDYFCPSERI